MAMTILLWTLAAILIAGGLAGLVLPALPGAVLLLAGLFVAAWIEDFAYIGAGIGATIGLVLGTAAKLALGFTMLGLALVMRFV